MIHWVDLYGKKKGGGPHGSAKIGAFKPLDLNNSATRNSRFPTLPCSNLTLTQSAKKPPSWATRFADAEEVRFELTVPCGTPVFKTGAIDHSATPPGLETTSPMSQTIHFFWLKAKRNPLLQN